MTKKIAVERARAVVGSGYPAPFNEPVKGRVRRRIGDVAGISQFGVNLTRLPPGGWSSQRHWHTGEDEFVFILSGEVVLVTDSGEETLRAGDCAGFKAGSPDGHHLQNRSQQEVVVLEVGARCPGDDDVFYPDIDLRCFKGQDGFAHNNGEPYADTR